MSKIIRLKQYNGRSEDGEITGVILADQIIAAYMDIDDEAIIYLELRNGNKIKHFGGYSDSIDELARIISELGWSD